MLLSLVSSPLSYSNPLHTHFPLPFFLGLLPIFWGKMRLLSSSALPSPPHLTRQEGVSETEKVVAVEKYWKKEEASTVNNYRGSGFVGGSINSTPLNGHHVQEREKLAGWAQGSVQTQVHPQSKSPCLWACAECIFLTAKTGNWKVNRSTFPHCQEERKRNRTKWWKGWKSGCQNYTLEWRQGIPSHSPTPIFFLNCCHGCQGWHTQKRTDRRLQEMQEPCFLDVFSTPRTSSAYLEGTGKRATLFSIYHLLHGLSLF